MTLDLTSISQRTVEYPIFQIPPSEVRSSIENEWIDANHSESDRILAEYYDVSVPTINFEDFGTPDGAVSGYDYSSVIVIDTSKLPSNILTFAAFLENFFYHIAHHKH